MNNVMMNNRREEEKDIINLTFSLTGDILQIITNFLPFVPSACFHQFVSFAA